MVVQHNLTAMNANRYLGINNNKLSKSLEKLSSGYAINRAGDNAAGLAVSEKMRSQIAGMTQGVKNAQDGISMVQTFEGALTETHSILQRMKTLADQMANGSYDDPVDRTSAQQEFLQLNDELDQIADTDFNGVVALNGGVMADGTKANSDGLIKYGAAVEEAAPAPAAPVREAGDIGTLALDLDDNADTADAAVFTTLNNNYYKGDEVAAKALWDKLGLSAKDVKAVDVVVTVNSVNEDGSVSYEITSGTAKADADDTSGETMDVEKLKEALNITPKNGDGSTITGDGGFIITTPASEDEDGNIINGAEVGAVFDATKLVAGDSLKLTFTAPQPDAEITKYAPAHVNMTTDTLKFTGKAGEANENLTTADAKGDIVMNVGSDVTDENMKAWMGKFLEALDGKKVEMEKTNAGWKVSFNGEEATAAGGDLDMTDFDQEGMSAKYENGILTISAKEVADLDAGKEWEEHGELELLTIDLSNPLNSSVTAETGDKLEFSINFDGYVAAPEPNTADSTADVKVGTLTRNEIKAAKSALTANEESGDKEDYDVSVSNAFNKSEAMMTYKDSITLQVGARTKDAVNFTFKYNSDAIGDLAADLNCTAKGLGTDKLNLSTQEAANYAVDKIDQAINKVSLVRGTFGAIQNRLEHKIDNMNVSIENLTSAESAIRDTNMPQEMMNFTKQQILAQASQSMLAQANQLPQGVLSLLQ